MNVFVSKIFKKKDDSIKVVKLMFRTVFELKIKSIKIWFFQVVSNLQRCVSKRVSFTIVE